MNKLTFSYVHYTKSFQGYEIKVSEDSLDIEFRDDDLISDVLPRVFLRVLRQIPKGETLEKAPPFDMHGFKHMTSAYSKKTQTWERMINPGMSAKRSDFIRVSTKFPPEIQERFIDEHEAYGDYLSQPQ